MIYVLIEKELLFQKIVSNDIKNLFEKSNASLLSKKLMIKIHKTYLKNEKFQQIINVKQVDDRKISIDLKKKFQLKLKNCRIIDNLLRVNDKIVIFENNVLRINIIKIHHDKFIIKHSNHIDIFVNVSQYYWWSWMTNTIKTYVRNCLIYNYFKAFREQKQKLLKLLFILNRYWQNIVCDFMTNLFSCKNDDRFYCHILVVIDKLFKSKKFISMNFMNI